MEKPYKELKIDLFGVQMASTNVRKIETGNTRKIKGRK